HADHIRAHPSAPEALLSVEQLGHATARLGDFIDQRGRLVDALRRQVAQPL
ncbi:MAG: hypothetical protein HY060_20790, partial [Proteobacteria bacterium]|nr:hypothetical protein [Pseudomonadota bacterium]